VTRLLRIGFMPLSDAGLLCVAAAKGFDREEGLRFELTPEPSWANLRDKLALGIYDAAHMLAPAVVASALGTDGFPAPMIGAVALGLDGNAISVAPAMAVALREKLSGDPADPRRTGAALAQVVAERAAQGLPPLRFAHVFPYSAHHYQLRLWLRAGGADPDGVRLTVTPPPLMQQAITGGYIDGFCVGEPWNTLAQQSGVAEILHPCRDLTANCPEKVLAFRALEALREPELPRAAARAVRRAALWGEAEENRVEFCRIVAERTGGGGPVRFLTLDGKRGQRPTRHRRGARGLGRPGARPASVWRQRCALCLFLAAQGARIRRYLQELRRTIRAEGRCAHRRAQTGILYPARRGHAPCFVPPRRTA
jgi:NitT/TauT family transport system ATP-binding protein